MKRTSEDAFDATIECIARLECSPVEILEALRGHFERRISRYAINIRKDGFPILLGKDEILQNLKTLNNSIEYVTELLAEPEPPTAKELSYDRFEENC